MRTQDKLNNLRMISPILYDALMMTLLDQEIDLIVDEIQKEIADLKKVDWEVKIYKEENVRKVSAHCCFKMVYDGCYRLLSTDPKIVSIEITDIHDLIKKYTLKKYLLKGE